MSPRRPSQQIDRAREAVEISRSLNGDKHPYTLKALSDLAIVHRDEGDLALARGLLEEVLEERRESQGEESDEVLRLEGLLSGIFVELGDLESARGLDEHVLECYERNNGPDDEATLNAVHNLSSTRYDQGDYQGVIQLEERILASENLRASATPTRRSVFAIARIANARRAIGEFDKAKELDEVVLAAARQIGEVPLILGAMRALLEDLAGLQEWDDAMELTRQVLERGLSDLSPDDEYFQHLKRNKRKLTRLIRRARKS
jgi:tetratricopeptide (TPR) repeat protein